MTTNFARFTINGTPAEDANGKRGYDAAADETLTCTLERVPATGVLTVQYQVFDPADPTSPLASKDADLQYWDANDEHSITSAAPNTSFDLTVETGTDLDSFVIRCTAVTATGAVVWERMISVRKLGLRMTTPAETQQYDQRGWSDAMNELTEFVGAGGSSLNPPGGGDDGKVAIALSQDLVYDFIDDNNIASGADIDITKLDYTSANEGEAIAIVAGTPAWSPVVNAVTVPVGADDGKIVYAQSSDFAYADNVKINSGQTGIEFGTAEIFGASGFIFYDVPTGTAHNFRINSVQVLSIAASTISFGHATAVGNIALIGANTTGTVEFSSGVTKIGAFDLRGGTSPRLGFETGDANVYIEWTGTASGAGGAFNIVGEAAGGTDQDGGDIFIRSGIQSGTGRPGDVQLSCGGIGAWKVTNPTGNDVTAVFGTTAASTQTLVALGDLKIEAGSGKTITIGESSGGASTVENRVSSGGAFVWYTTTSERLRVDVDGSSPRIKLASTLSILQFGADGSVATGAAHIRAADSFILALKDGAANRAFTFNDDGLTLPQDEDFTIQPTQRSTSGVGHTFILQGGNGLAGDNSGGPAIIKGGHFSGSGSGGGAQLFSNNTAKRVAALDDGVEFYKSTGTLIGKFNEADGLFHVVNPSDSSEFLAVGVFGMTIPDMGGSFDVTWIASTTTTGGATTITGQQSTDSGSNGGAVSMIGGIGPVGGGTATLQGGSSVGTGGAAWVRGGNGTTNGDGGDVIVRAGLLAGGGTSGSAKIQSATGATRVEVDDTGIGFGVAPVAKPTVTGSRAGNAALADLLTDLATLGLITDSTSA